MSIESIANYQREIRRLVNEIPKDKLTQIIELLHEARDRQVTTYLMGNGGSATTASHIAGDLQKTCGVPTRCLSDSIYLITAWANDRLYEDIFTQQMCGEVDAGDIVMILSASGTSRNIVEALQYAKELHAMTISLTGFDGGEVKNIADYCIVVPSTSYEQIEDIHLMIGHILVNELKEK